jgi:hypothetical protein
LKLSALEPKRPALVKPVTRITNINDCLSVPKNPPAVGQIPPGMVTSNSPT